MLAGAQVGFNQQTPPGHLRVTRGLRTGVAGVWDDGVVEDGVVQVSSWLSERCGPLGSAPVLDTSVLDGLRSDLEHVAADALASTPRPLEAEDLPLRLPKGRLADLERCERSAVARAVADDVPASGLAMLRGTALDHFVAHQLVAGRVREPVTDLTSMLEATGDHDSLASMAGIDLAVLEPELDSLAAAVADAWSGIDAAWAPRVQTPAALVLAHGACICRGVLDVELGGPGTGLPGVVVEVKSAPPAAAHPHEVYLYALLVALRDHAAPAVVARWYPGAAPVGITVTTGVLEAAAARLAAGLRRWAQLRAGATPAERPGGWCSWCPDRGPCPSAADAAEVAVVVDG